MYERLIQLATNTPWAIDRRYAAIIQDILAFRARGGRLTGAEIRARVSAADPQPRQTRAVVGALAVLPVWGPITHRAFQASSGVTSVETIKASFRQLLSNDQVGTILLDVSSPGGIATGIPELADDIFQARATKRVVAIANAQAMSAAYWLASQASELVVTPSGEVGSVGVYLITEDWSEWLETQGIKINAMSAGDHKLEGAPWQPLSAESRDFLQRDVNTIYRQFLSAVARGRGTSVADVERSYGQGRGVPAGDAVRLGMADRVETIEQTIARLSGRPTSVASSASSRATALAYADATLALLERS